MSSYLQHFNLKPRIITSYGPDLVRHTKGQFTLLPQEPNRTETLTFENIIQPGQPRKWRAHKVDASLPPTLTPELKAVIAEADVLILASLLSNYDANWLKDALSATKPACLKVLSAQGYLRKVENDGSITSCEFKEAAKILPMFNVAFVSEDDAPDAARMAQGWKKLAPQTNIIVTNGAGGATIIHENDFQNIPTNPIPANKIVDSVGCGDVFAAAVSLALYGGEPLDVGVLIGHAAAARKLLAHGAPSSHTSAVAYNFQ
jgi:sugar/nucleoside kinase (ribokinase family)